ncbi:MAG: DUF362 domain-containing protein [Deltaproteobacteria bacterium]|nr:DUF362 domain-containing protein [Deltaproteobacteria bacterium]
MNRRIFLSTVFFAGLGFSAPRKILRLALAADASAPADIAVVSGLSPETITRSAVEILGGMSRFVGRGDRVVVKPNIGWDRPPEMAATTNPHVVAELVRLALSAGANKVTVLDNTVSDPRRCYTQSGIAAAAAAAGAAVSYVEDRRFIDATLGGTILKRWPIYRDILEADKLINVPIAKTHGTSILTLGMKNLMGVMGGWRSRIHQRIDESLVDLAFFVKPTLVVLDAVRILRNNGPQGSRIEDVSKLDTVIAGVDQVAVDSLGASLFGMEGRDLGYVRIGHERGLGTMDLARLVVRRKRI